MIEKLQYWIEQIPWYAFCLVVVYFLFKVYFNAESESIVVVSAIGTACFAYLAAHNLLIGRKVGLKAADEN